MQNLGGSMSPRSCEQHHWVAHVRGGQPLSISTCSLCDEINWGLLKADFEEKAREFARTAMEKAYGRHEYPDGSRSLCRRGLVNVTQVYSLFSKPEGQDETDAPGLAPEKGCFMPEHHAMRRLRRADPRDFIGYLDQL